MKTPVHLLIVEDSPDDTELVLLELRRAGLTPKWRRVESADELKSALAEEPWDAVLSDYTLPGFGAHEALRVVRQFDPDLPFIVVSGTIGEEIATETMRAGASDYVLKQNLTRLALAIQRELREASNRRARRAAERDAFRLAAIVSSTEDAVVSETLESIITTWNPAAERMFGWTVADMIGRSTRELVPADQLEQYESLRRHVLDTGRAEQYETYRLGKSGNRLELSITLSPILDKVGTVIGLSRIYRNISRRKRAEESIEQLAAIIECSPDFIAIVEKDLKLRFLNSAGLNLVGLDVAAESPSRLLDFFRGEDALTVERDVMPALVSKGQWAGEIGFRHFRNGERITARSHVFCLPNHSADELLYACLATDIWEQKRSAEALAASERRFRATVEKSFDGLTLLSRSGTLLYASPAVTRLSGFTLEEILGGCLFDFVHPDDRTRFEDRWARLLQQPGGISADVTRFRTKAGGWFYSESTLTNLLDDPDVGAIISNFRDVTERVRAETSLRRVSEELSRTNQLLNAVVDNSADAIYVKDRAGRYLLFNQAAANFVGKPVSEVLGNDDSALFDPESVRIVMDQDRRVMESGKLIREEDELTTDGTCRVYQAIKAPYRDAQGAVIGLIGISRDITERKRAEDALRQSEERYRTLLACIPEPLFVYDVETLQYVAINDAAVASYGYGRDEWSNMTLRDIRPPEDVPALLEYLSRTTGGYENRGVWRHRKKDGTIFEVEIIAREITLAKRRACIILARDVTVQQRAQRALQNSVEAERRASALTSAIVNALPAHIALLDAEGTIVSVNEAWERFAESNIFQGPHHGVGVNYIRVCEKAADNGAEEAPAVAAGLQAVLTGNRPEFSLEYSCHAPSERRWFRVMISPLMHGLTGAVVMHVDVTDRRLAEQSLRHSEARLRLALEATSLGTFDWDVQERRLEWDERANEVFGLSKGEKPSIDLFADLLHPADREATMAKVNAALDPGGDGRYEVEYRVRRRDNEVRWVAARGRVSFEGRTGRLKASRFVGTVLDITERKKAEALLRDSEAKLAEAVRIARMGYWSRDLSTGFVEWSDELVRIFGMDPSNVSRTFEAFLESAVLPEDRQRVRQRIEKALAGAESFEHTYRVRVHGEIRFIHEVGRVFLSEDGRPARLSGTARNVTEEARAIETLKLRDRAIQSVNAGIVITDPKLPDNPMVYASPGLEKLTGYRQEELIGRNCRMLQGRETHEDAVASVKACIREERSCEVELLNYRKDGTPFWNALSISPVRDDDGRLTHFVGVQTDVSERHRLEEQFRQAQKMEAVGRLAGGVAHDFNNLLTVINGYGEIVVGSLPIDHPARELVGHIRDAGERAATLTRQLLAFSRKTVLEPKVLDLNSEIHEMEKLLRRLIGEDITLTASLEPDLARVKADPGQLQQAVINLCVNARDAMPYGGRLTIETRNVELDASYTQEFPDVLPGRYVLLAVTDSGHGMDAATQARIFEPFFTTKGPGLGTGLGLAMIYGFVKQSSGHIAVYSELGSGATFKIYLPRVASGTSSSKIQPVLTALPKGTETVLLVEDEPGVRALTRHVLQSCGYKVLEAGLGKEALRIAERQTDPIHLLITDVVMPEGLGGRQVAEFVRSRHPESKVLFVSGYTDDAIVLHGVLEANTNFLQKPFTPASLSQKVRDVLDAVSSVD